MDSIFPYLDQYPETNRFFHLQKTPVRPKAVASAKWIRHPDSIVQDSTPETEMVTNYGNSHLVLDFGEEVVGHFEMTVTATGQLPLMVVYGEDYEKATREQDYDAQWVKMPRDNFEVKLGSNILINQGRRAFRFMHLSIPEGNSSMKLNKLVFINEHYPSRFAGSFSCSDHLINQSWALARNTIKLCMQQYFEDGIYRDGLLWSGDQRVQTLSALYAFGDIEMARKCMFMIAACQMADGSLPATGVAAGGHQHPHNINYMPGIAEAVKTYVLIDFMAQYLDLVSDYWNYIGEENAINEIWPCIARAVCFLGKGVDYNSLTPGVDYITDNQFDINTPWWGSPAALHMNIIIGMQKILPLAKMLKDSDTAQLCTRLLKQMNEKVKLEFYDKENGIFSENSLINPNPLVTTRLGWHANIYATLAGLTNNQEDNKKLYERLFKKQELRYPVSGYMQFMHVQALWKAEFHCEALNELRTHYAWMLQHGFTTGAEKLDLIRGERPTQDYPTSHCHGWTAWPCYFLPAFILGVQPLEPGFKSVLIQPNLVDLKWAEGTIPTPAGDVFVHWENQPNQHGLIELPDKVTGTAILQSDNNYVRFPLISGINKINSNSN